MKTAYCIWCAEKTPYDIHVENKHLIHANGIGFFVKELNATCRNCGFDIYVPEVNDQNVARREEAYRKSLIRRRRYKDLVDSYKYKGPDFTAISR